MLCVTEFLQSADCRRGRSSASSTKNHRTALYCRPAFLLAAVRKSASEVPLRFIDALRYAPDIVRSQPRTASPMPFATLRTSSAHSRGRLASSAEIPYCVLTSFGGGRLAAAGFCVSARLALVFQRGYLLCSGVIYNPPEHDSLITVDYKSTATEDFFVSADFKSVETESVETESGSRIQLPRMAFLSP